MLMFNISRKDGVGEVQTVHGVNLLAACEALSGNGVHPLNVEKIAEESVPEIHAAPTTPAPPPDVTPPDESALGFSSFSGPLVTDATAKTRIEAQHAALIASGVNVNTKEQFFETGTRMARDGYSTQAARKAEHDRALPVRDAGEALMRLVLDERRRDVVVSAREFADGIHANGQITVNGHAIGEQAIRGLSAHLESPMLGYVLGVRDRIAGRKSNVPDGEKAARNDEDRAKIAEVMRHECLSRPGERFKLRLRDVGANGRPDCFAVVGETYSPADAPEALDQLLGQLPSEARATYAYDAKSTTWELRASVWTPTPVSQHAVGEAFEGYVSFSSRDNGTAKFRGGGGVTLLRCLNASTYCAEGVGVARIHRGRILYAIDRMLRQSLAAIEALTTAWGVNRETAIEVPTEHKGKRVTIEDAIPGFYSYMLRGKGSDLVNVLPGRTKEHAAGLARAYFSERRDPEKLVRSDLAQGFTRYIQGQPADVRRDAEKAIGTWLVNANAPLKCELV